MTQRIDIATTPAGPPDDLLAVEWLLTNGRGSFAASTAAGVNTRKYHGLLVSALGSPGERAVLLAALGEELSIGGRSWSLSCFRFSDRFHPRGDRLLAAFERDPAGGWVRFTYRIEQMTLRRTVVLARGADALAVRYDLAGGGRERAAVVVQPFFALRHYHANRRAEDGQPAVLADLAGRTLRLSDPAGRWPDLRVELLGPFLPAAAWWHRFFHAAEADRGEDPWEDLYAPGRLELPLADEKSSDLRSAELRLAVAPFEPVSFADALAGQQAHRAELVRAASGATSEASRPVPRSGEPDQATAAFALAADDFVVDASFNGEREPLATVLAGFPWFADWGRDTFIALEGLLLCTGRAALARRVLERFARAIRNGLVPNRFSDAGAGRDYNSVDASLWFIHAAFAWARSADAWDDFDANLLPAAQRILEAFRRGTEFGIRVDADGLLAAGSPGTQLTWMDATADGTPVTPRHGKPVEVNALYGHALRLVRDRLAARGDGSAGELADRLARWRDSFVAKFPSPRGGLYDCLGPDGAPDAAVRPNQLLAVALGDEVLRPELARGVVELCRERLLTPFGLRSLAPGERGYRGQCVGPRAQRDRAYHQGAVWAWLIGPFVEAHLRVNAFSDGAKQQAARWLAPLIERVNGAAGGQIPEIFDGDSPHAPRGCFAQAWSVAEVIRARALTGSAAVRADDAIEGRR